MRVRTYGLVGQPRTTISVTFTSDEIASIYEDKPEITDEGLEKLLMSMARHRLRDPVSKELPSLFPINV